MRKIIISIIMLISTMAYSQRIVPYPYSSKFKGSVEATDSVITPLIHFTDVNISIINDTLPSGGLVTSIRGGGGIMIDTTQAFYIGTGLLGKDGLFLSDSSIYLTDEGLYFKDSTLNFNKDGITIGDQAVNFSLGGLRVYDSAMIFGGVSQDINLEGMLKFDESEFLGYIDDDWVSLDNSFDGSRAVRSGISGISGTYGGTTTKEFLEAVFFTSAPTVSLLLNTGTSNLVYEVGTTNVINLNSVTTNTSGLTLGTGTFNGTDPEITFVLPATVDTSFSISFTPRESEGGAYTARSYSFYVTRPYTGAIAGTAQSSTRTLTGVYVYLTGESATDYSTATGTTLYLASGIDHGVVVESTSKTVSFTASDEYLYFAYPQSYGRLTSILDQNGFENFTAFDEYSITVSSSGLVVDYTLIGYYLYKSKTKKTLTSFSYTFKQ